MKKLIYCQDGMSLMDFDFIYRYHLLIEKIREKNLKLYLRFTSGEDFLLAGDELKLVIATIEELLSLLIKNLPPFSMRMHTFDIIHYKVKLSLAIAISGELW